MPSSGAATETDPCFCPLVVYLSWLYPRCVFCGLKRAVRDWGEVKGTVPSAAAPRPRRFLRASSRAFPHRGSRPSLPFLPEPRPPSTRGHSGRRAPRGGRWGGAVRVRRRSLQPSPCTRLLKILPQIRVIFPQENALFCISFSALTALP